MKHVLVVLVAILAIFVSLGSASLEIVEDLNVKGDKFLLPNDHSRAHLLALPPGWIDEESGVLHPDDPIDPTLETNSTRGSLPTTDSATVRLVHYYWNGNDECKTTQGVHRQVIMYSTGNTCYRMYGAGYTTPKYYRAVCRGSPMSDDIVSFNESASLQFYSDAECTQPTSSELLVDQRTCLPAGDFNNESQVFFCEVGVAPCLLCDNAATTAVLSAAAVATAGFALWYGL